MTDKHALKNKSRGISIKAVLSFFGSLALCSILVWGTIINNARLERLQVEQIIISKSLRINEVISKLLFITNSLSSIVVQRGGVVDDFEMIAPILVNHPAIFNVLIAPGGIVSHVYPLGGGNANLIGWDFFSEGAGNRDALTARDSGALVLGGPFQTVINDGREVLVGSYPVYIDTPEEPDKFWGLVSVTLRFPEAIAEAELEILKAHGFAYELWKINPDTGERQVMVGDYEFAGSYARYFESRVSVSSADWYLKVWPIRAWYNYPQNIAYIIAGLIVSLLVFFITQNNYHLKKMKYVWESEARSDPLTGIYNRRHFMEISAMNTERARRLRVDCYIILFDLDRFKSVNDTHGHVIGDKVLIETTVRIKAVIRPYDLFARYGGEEFIIYASDINKDNVIKLAERLRMSLCSKMFEFGEIKLSSSASFGIAYLEDYNIEKAIFHADMALYQAKRGGRNRTVFWGDEDNDIMPAQPTPAH